MVSFLMRRLLKYWLPIFLWMIFIFVGSTDVMSSEHTSRFLIPFLRWLIPDLSDPTAGTIQLCIRKCAHLLEYAILSVLLLRAFRQNHMQMRGAFVSAFVGAVLYAVLDEFHQSFVQSRTASPYDVGIDILGALTGMIIYWLLFVRSEQRTAIENRTQEM